MAQLNGHDFEEKIYAKLQEAAQQSKYAYALTVGYLDRLTPHQKEQKKACHVRDESLVWVVFDTGSTNIWVSSVLCRGAKQRDKYFFSFPLHKIWLWYLKI
eukprot:s531_g18.t1